MILATSRSKVVFPAVQTSHYLCTGHMVYEVFSTGYKVMKLLNQILLSCPVHAMHLLATWPNNCRGRGVARRYLNGRMLWANTALD